LLSVTREEKEITRQNPLYQFMYALGSLEQQAIEFLDNAREKGVQSAQKTITTFLDFHKERVRRKELAAGTLKNY
jgi:hypothetical protein